MPQMGESIAEGTIVRWIKKVGDTVERDEPLFEISTDKVDAEIPSPAAGVITEIRAKEGETVEVNSVVAVIGEAGAQPTAAPSAPRSAEPPKPPSPAPPTPAASARPQTVAAPAVQRPPQGTPSAAPTGERDASQEEMARHRSSPLVRKIAKEHNVDIGQIHGTGT